jgi:phage terminase Nu1 subunit (DNA packaging protein)
MVTFSTEGNLKKHNRNFSVVLLKEIIFLRSEQADKLRLIFAERPRTVERMIKVL